MKLRWWRHANQTTPSDEARAAVDDAQRKLLVENIRGQTADTIGIRAEFLRRRNHYGEAAAKAMLNWGRS